MRVTVKLAMHTHLLCMGLAGVLAMGTPAAAPGQQTSGAGISRQDRGARVAVTGQVTEIHAARLFSMTDATRLGRELLVLTPRQVSPSVVGATVKVEGTFRSVDAAQLRQQAGWSDMDEREWARLERRPVLVAASVMAARESDAPQAVTAPETAEAPAPGTEPAAAWDSPAVPLTIPATTLASFLDGLAGQQLRITNARVVGVLEPGAFLIEPATRYLKSLGERDRFVVMIDRGILRVSPEMLVGSVVRVQGIARTILGVQVTAETPWPARLTPETVDRLEVRGAVLASSVQTAEGTELTQRR